MNARITTLLAAASLLAACDGNDIKVSIETHSSHSETHSSAESSSSEISSVGTTSSSISSQQEALNTLAFQRASWQRYSTGHFTYEFYRDCFCFGRDDFSVEWKNGEIISSNPIGDATTPLIDGISPNITALFDTIESAIKEGHLKEAVYNHQYGYPERVVIDPLPGAADDESNYRITNFKRVQISSSSSSSAPRTLSDAEKAERTMQRDIASATWSNYQDRSYQYQLGDYGNCIVGFFNCNGIYDYTSTTFGVVNMGEAILGYGKSISNDEGQIYKSAETLDSYANLSDGFVTNPNYRFNYSPEGIASWRYYFPDRFDDDRGGVDLLKLEFFDDLEATRQMHAANWQAYKPNGEYSYTLTVDCDCYFDGSHRVVVTNSDISATPLSAKGQLPDDMPAIEALFDRLASAFSDPMMYVAVSYDQSYHFPQSITFNPTLARSDTNITYTVSAFSDRSSLNEASKALAKWRPVSDRYYEYLFESKELSVNLYLYIISALGGQHQVQKVIGESDVPPLATNIEEVYETIFKYSDARDIEFKADTYGVPTEVRIHPADREPGDYLQYLISNFQLRNSADSSTVADMQQLWESGAISHYLMTVNVSCFCLFTGPIEVEVKNGEIIRAYSKELGRELTEQESSWRIYTIAGLFKDITETIENKRTAEVLFNSEYHYPQLVVIDRAGQAVDAGFNLEITGFKVLD